VRVMCAKGKGLEGVECRGVCLECCVCPPLECDEASWEEKKGKEY
jgi:hypothetical protein